MAQTTISFEFFPPKNESAENALWKSLPRLQDRKPSFLTVTYGAGGSTQDGTLKTVCEMQKRTNLPVAAHLTYINTPVCDLKKLTDSWWDKGIRHIVALRGDMPDDLAWPLDLDKDYFQFTSEFVRALKSWHDFEISVGAYPEKHPDADNITSDIEALRRKCNAGADQAITQFFFDNDVYYHFVDQCQKAGIAKPIIPGLLPIHSFKNMCNFAARCQAHVPEWLHEKFNGLEDKPEEAKKIAIELLEQQVQCLQNHGVPHIHFYTLNKCDITSEACQSLKI